MTCMITTAAGPRVRICNGCIDHPTASLNGFDPHNSACTRPAKVWVAVVIICCWLIHVKERGAGPAGGVRIEKYQSNKHEASVAKMQIALHSIKSGMHWYGLPSSSCCNTFCMLYPWEREDSFPGKPVQTTPKTRCGVKSRAWHLPSRLPIV